MKEKQAEQILSVLYISCALLSIISLTCLVTVWQYWKYALDVCDSINCGCILYSINTFASFTGGDEKFCHFGVYGLIPIIIIGLCLGGYHGYRSCINRNLDTPIQIYNGVNRNLNSTTVVIRPKNRTPYKQWIPAVFLTILLCCLSLAHAIVMTDGYYKSCEQYKKRLIYLLNSGREAEVIRNKLSCGAIFDFMDYLQTDMTDNNKWIMNKEIDTGFAFQLAIISTWLNFFTWTFAFLLNIIMARKRFR